jgi:hypothetical protein
MDIFDPPGLAWLWPTAWPEYDPLPDSQFRNYLATEVTEITEIIEPIPAFSEFILGRAPVGPEGPRISLKSFKLFDFSNDM